MSVKYLLALALTLAALPAFASNDLPDACGSADVKFDVKTAKASTPAQAPASGQAQLVFIETLHKPGNVLVKPTIRVGLDGSWAGALKGSSYFSVLVPSGEHHLCVSWQSHFGTFRKNLFAKSVALEPGKTYFLEYKADLIATDGGAQPVTDFDFIDADQGKFFMKSYPVATWTTNPPITQASTH